MSYWDKYEKWVHQIIEAYVNLKGTHSFVLVDGGASGELSSPFRAARKVILPVRFEPRGKDTLNLNGNDVFIDGGLWEDDCVKNLHIAKAPTVSSICPPNQEFIQNFDDKHGVNVRTTVEVTPVKLRSIDSCVQKGEMPLPNFIKLDTHSAELPALKGSKNSLSECVGLLVETWNSEVHVSQGLHYEIERFAIENGFQVYDQICSARWQIKHKNKINTLDRGRYIGTELLLIKSDPSRKLDLEKALVLSLFGFFNEAKNILANSLIVDAKSLYDAIVDSQRMMEKSFKNKLKANLQKALNSLRGYTY